MMDTRNYPPMMPDTRGDPTHHTTGTAMPTHRRPWIIAAISMTVAVVAVAVAAAVFLLRPSAPGAAVPTTATTSTEASATFTLAGTFGIYADPAAVKLADGAPCQGAGAGASITAGAPVTVYDSEGKLLATGMLGPGKYVTNVVACVFRLSVPAVPEGLATYGVEVGQSGVHEVRSTLAHGNVLLFVGP